MLQANPKKTLGLAMVFY